MMLGYRRLEYECRLEKLEKKCDMDYITAGLDI